MLDLFSGLGGASQAMVDRGWTVYRVEIEERRQPTIVADVKALPLKSFYVDLLWASPPCVEYARYSMPWYGRVPPDLTLWQTTERLISEWQPRFWIIENTVGARQYHGKDSRAYGSHWLWSNLPIWPIVVVERNHEHYRGSHVDRSARRAKIPYDLSLAIAEHVEYLVS